MQGLALRKPMEKDVEADQMGFKLQKLWSGLRKRWADSCNVSKREELQVLKDKMRPCYKDQAMESQKKKAESVGSSSSETEMEDEHDDLFKPLPLDALMFEKNKSFLDMCGVNLHRKKSLV